MRRIGELTGALVIAGALTGCGGAPVTAQASAKAPAVEATTTARARPSAPWRTYRDPVFGFSVALPEEPMWMHTKDPSNGVEQRSFHLSLDTFEIDAVVTANELHPTDFDLKTLAERMRKELMPGAQISKGERGGVVTYELSGKSKGGGPTRVLLETAGLQLLALSIQGEKSLDDAMVERFFDSARLDPPWRLEAFEDGLTVSLPPDAHAAGEQTKDDIVVTSFMTSAALPVWFGVSTKALPPATTIGVPTETLIDAYVKGITHPGVKVLRQTKIDLHGVTGREVITTVDMTQHFRTRVFVVGTTVYVVAIGCEDEASIMDDTATRTLDSMRLRPSP